jgi:hypothetical protein
MPQVIEAFAPNRADEALDVAVLPQRKGHFQIALELQDLGTLKLQVAERGGFEPPVPLGLTWAKFGPSSAHYYAQITASG